MVGDICGVNKKELDMDIKDRVIVVTGAASGIGKSLVKIFYKHGAKHVVSADVNIEGISEVSKEYGGTAMKCDVSREGDIAKIIRTTEREIGPISIFCSNAGIGHLGGIEVPNDDWQKIWEINLMAHVWAARHLVPLMEKRGEGYLLNTASAAGLLSQVGDASYSTTKHAAIGLGEWLAFSYAKKGIKVSMLCPQGVRTAMTDGLDPELAVAMKDGMLEPDDVAEECVKTINEERFLVLPHPVVEKYIQYKTSDYDGWLAGMSKLNERFRY